LPEMLGDLNVLSYLNELRIELKTYIQK